MDGEKIYNEENQKTPLNTEELELLIKRLRELNHEHRRWG